MSCPTGWPGFALRALGHRRRRRQPSGLAPRNEGLDTDGVVAQHGTRTEGPATAPTRRVVTAPRPLGAQHIDVPELLPRSVPTRTNPARSARRSDGGQTGLWLRQSRSGRSARVAAVHSSGVQPVVINVSR